MLGNTFHFIGRLTKDPELRKTNSGKSVTTVTLALDRPRRNGEDQGADFVRIQVWGQQAENLCKYMSKGRQLAVTGHVTTGSYKKGEETIYTQDFIADEVKYLGAGGNGGSQKKSDEAKPEASPDVEDSFQQLADDIPF